MANISLFNRHSPAHSRWRDPFDAFDNFFNQALQDWPQMELPQKSNTLGFSMDVTENETAYTLHAELAGVKKEDVDIRIEGETLTIQGEKKNSWEDKGDNYHRIERSYGSFCRKMTIPSNVDTAYIEADCKDGVLTLTLPKKKETQEEVKKISIK